MIRTSLAVMLTLAFGSAAVAQTAPPPVGAPPAATAAPVPAASGGDYDPFEPFNRKMFAIYQVLDRVAIRPAAVFYKHAVPSPFRTGLRNAFSNLGEPVVFLNDVLQVHPKAAGTTFGRFALNSTFGLAGLFDIATDTGLPYHPNGFGNTLGRYGAPPGAYLFIPVLGPSDIRDSIGNGIDSLTDPFTWISYPGRWEVSASRTVIVGLDTRANADAQLKAIYSTATDPYASIRSLYLQNRQSQINGGKVNLNTLPSFGPEPAASSAATPGPAASSLPAAPEKLAPEPGAIAPAPAPGSAPTSGSAPASPSAPDAPSTPDTSTSAPP